MRLVIKEDKEEKRVASKNYNYYLNKKTGYFARWGKTLADDPTVGPAPEILDLEISTSVQPHEQHLYPSNRICSEGGCKGNCKDWCYKSNAYNLPVYNMSFEEFKNIFHKMPRTLVSIAFGIMNIDTNPDFFKMARYAREHGVMPTFTMHGLDDISDETIEEIKSLFGACAISLYNKERSYNLIKRLTDAGMDQVNIHFLLAEQTYEKALLVLEDMKTDERLKKLNALVFLSLKKKGNAVNSGYQPLDMVKFKSLVDRSLEDSVRFGFDSCTANKFLAAIGDRDPDFVNRISQMVDPCESTLFSSYINARGEFYACSFCEGHEMWKEGIDVFAVDKFEEVWNNDKTEEFRERLSACGRSCPMFEV